MAKHHISVRIEVILEESDQRLSEMFDGPGPEIMKNLEAKKANGELFIGSVGCDGFCPFTGCPGHLEGEEKP